MNPRACRVPPLKLRRHAVAKVAMARLARQSGNGGHGRRQALDSYFRSAPLLKLRKSAVRRNVTRRRIKNKGLHVHACVIMPGHFHALVSSDGESMEKIMQALKSYTSG